VTAAQKRDRRQSKGNSNVSDHSITAALKLGGRTGKDYQGFFHGSEEGGDQSFGKEERGQIPAQFLPRPSGSTGWLYVQRSEACD